MPLKSDTGIIGWISVTRKEAGAFADKDVELLQTFADQAVIAIQNVELFEEVQARTRDLTESLQQQTATVRRSPDHKLVAWRSGARIRKNAGERNARLQCKIRVDALG